MTSSRSFVPTASQAHWLTAYSFARAAFSLAWIAVVLVVGITHLTAAAVLLVLYPAWDAAANWVDARRSGGLAANPSQLANGVISLLATAAVLTAEITGTFPVLYVFGVWAGLAGLLQLVTAVRRWRVGGQWAMALSGAQSVLAGAFFFLKVAPTLGAAAAAVVPYAGFGAFYFLVSAVWLAFRGEGGFRAARG